MMKTIFSALGLLLASLVSAQTLQFEYISTQEDGTAGKTVMFVSENFVKIDGLANLNSATVLFNKEKQTVYLINHSAKTYVELVKSEVEHLNEQLAEFAGMLREQSANFPPDQLDMVREMMKQNGYAVAMPKMTYKKEGSSKVGDWKCSKYNGTAYNKNMLELHSTKLENLGLKEGDLEILNAFAPFLAVLIDASNISKGSAAVFCPNVQWEGFPVKAVDYLGGKAIITTTLNKVERVSSESSTFNLPAGYSKTYFELGY
jgi:hypothetical protein